MFTTYGVVVASANFGALDITTVEYPTLAEAEAAFAAYQADPKVVAASLVDPNDDVVAEYPKV